MPLFEYGYDSPQLGTVLLSLVAAFLSLFMAPRPVSARKTGARVVAIALLASLSTLMGGPWTLTVGLLALAGGDALLVQQDQRALLPGFAGLVAGQVIYVLMLMPVAQPGNIATHPLLLLPLAVGIAAVVIVAMRMGASRWSARAPELLTLVSCLGTCLVAVATPLAGVAIGCLLVLPYAIIMAWSRRVGTPSAVLETVGWAFFYWAQLLITLGALGLL